MERKLYRRSPKSVDELFKLSGCDNLREWSDAWNEASDMLGVDPRILRPSDRFAIELQELENWGINPGLDLLAEWFDKLVNEFEWEPKHHYVTLSELLNDVVAMRLRKVQGFKGEGGSQHLTSSDSEP